LVLAQRSASEGNWSGSTVSIPHWFSLNETSQKKWYHLCIVVSIPHWFSLNVTMKLPQVTWFSRFHPTLVLAQQATPENWRRDTGFHPTLVLAQRRGDREITLFSCKVSIPHWFSLNVIALALAAWGNSSFPSHIGSRSTRGRLDKVQQKPRVSIPHWFSLNAWEKIGGDADSLRFPSHIGSRSTATQ